MNCGGGGCSAEVAAVQRRRRRGEDGIGLGETEEREVRSVGLKKGND